MTRIATATELKAKREAILASRDPSQPWISVCGGTGCLALGAEQVGAAFRKELEKQKLKAKVNMALTGCPGFCERGPLVMIYPQAILYERVKPEDVPEIISQTVRKGKVIDHLLYEDPATGRKVVHEHEVPFYKEQERMLLGDNSRLDPTHIDDYIALGGYSAAAKALTEMTPEEIIEAIKRSGLRGRGGAGFPTGPKWETCRKARGDSRYVICNAEEGDPGVFVDRNLLGGNPHSILEGMIIGAYAVGAHEGIIYVRNDYLLAMHNSDTAIRQAREYGLLGKNILGSGFDFDVRVHRAAGAYVCGESSALMRSLEGFAGEPRAKHIHATEKGLWDQPTVLNNVKTWASVRHIINNGADWFAQIGTETSKGTMVFSLAGKINNTGLVEVPMGITLRRLIFDIGGGIPGGKKFKAVQTGGPSGGCVPERLLNLPVDYESLTGAGSMMGSGGMIVMDEDTCMVDVARYFLSFNREESCGKCTACREGITRMHYILNEITHGRGREGDIELLEELGQAMLDASLCALGRMAPTPVLTTIRYFRDEYEAHIKDKRCPAGVCTDLV